MEDYRIKLCVDGAFECVQIGRPNHFRVLRVSHATFRAACCEAFGLVDPDANADEVCPRTFPKFSIGDVLEKNGKRWQLSPFGWQLLNKRNSNHASEVLAAASRRLA